MKRTQSFHYGCSVSWICTALLKISLLSTLTLPQVSAWDWGSGTNSDTTMYGNAINRDWLSDSKSISINVGGCVWGVVNHNDGDAGCMEDESEDGTTYWYQMAECRRAQVAFSLYASSSGSTSCSSGNFKESFMTINGVSEFVYYMQQYDSNSPFGSGDDDSYADLPMCEGGDNGYIGVGCADDGSFALLYFEDEYCLEPSGTTYDSLKSLNKAMNNYYKSCPNIYQSKNGDNTLPYTLAYYSETCSSMETGYCSDSDLSPNNVVARTWNKRKFVQGKTWLTKLKYVTGGLLLLASFVMFTGILFTNRRRRRALMQRKYRQSKGRDDRSRRSKASRSKSRSRRSKSRSKRSSSATSGEKSGVLA